MPTVPDNIFPASKVHVSMIYSFPLISPIKVATANELPLQSNSGSYFFDPVIALPAGKKIEFQSDISAADDLPQEIRSIANMRAAWRFISAESGSASLTITFNLDSTAAGSSITHETFFALLDSSRRTRLRQPAKPDAHFYASDDNTHRLAVKIMRQVLRQAAINATDDVIDQFIERHDAAFQAPYVLTWLELNCQGELKPWSCPPSETNPISRQQRQLAIALHRPLNWQQYWEKPDLFRVSDAVIKYGEFVDKDLFWHENGLLLYHPRSTMLVTIPNGANPNPIGELVWESLSQMLADLRARWHMYIEIGQSVNRIARDVLEMPAIQDLNEKKFAEISALRNQFIQSMSDDAPRAAAATQLLALAHRAERTFDYKEHFEYTLRKFESLNWLLGDRLEQRRIRVLAGARVQKPTT